MKLAIVSQALPPAWSGQAMLIHRLLERVDESRYCLVAERDQPTASVSVEFTKHLKADRFELSPRRPSRLSNPLLALLANGITVIRGAARRIGEIQRILVRERCDAVVAFTGFGVDIPTAYLASSRTRTRFYAYLCDDYAARETFWAYRLPARLVEPWPLKRADGVVVPNEFLQEKLRCRFGIDAKLVRNPVDLSLYAPYERGEDLPGRATTIVYTGAVYQAHYDCFVNLVRALGRSDAKLHLYTAQDADDLAERGIRGPVVFHPHEPARSVPGIQTRADVLFLPLAFESPYPEVIRTSSPAKMAEYLASGRPILVHAPANSFVAWYFRQHKCGVVVDRNDPELLADELEALLTDPELQATLGRNARARAEADFDVADARAAFARLVGFTHDDLRPEPGPEPCVASEKARST
jgi:glycosyltransferase involved in cell wall biosynthesis